MNASRRRAVAGLLVALLLAPALAHDDDPKVLDKQPPYLGPGFRAALAHDPGRSLPLAATSLGPPSGPVFVSPVPFSSVGVHLLSWLPVSEFGPFMSSGADCWGYVTPGGKEYAIIGLSGGTGFVDVSQPDNAQVVAVLGGPTSLWRDVKTYAGHAYVVSEGGSGIQVYDLSLIEAGAVTFLGNVLDGGGTTASHNVAVDQRSARLYRCGGGDHGLRIYSLANPASPAYQGSWDDRYVHDAQVFTYLSGPHADKQIAFCGTGYNGGFDDPGIDILDVTNPGAIQNLSRFVYPNPVYAHQCWLSADGTLLYVNDELDEDGTFPTTTYVIDVTDLTQPSLAGTFTNGNTAVGHNLYVRNDGLLFAANYRSGLRIFDVGVSATNPPEIAWFDVYPQDDSDDFNGLWSVYPYLPSGMVIGSDLEKGLFVWHLGMPLVSFSNVDPVPVRVHPDGSSWTVRIAEASPGDLQQGTEKLHVLTPSGWASNDLVPLGAGEYEAILPPLPCGWMASFYLSAQSTDGITWTAPSVAAGDVHRAAVTSQVTQAIAHDMEGGDMGWVSGAPGDDATEGLWERGDPRGTEAQPFDDHGAGLDVECWFTGQGPPGGGVGEADVDGGTTTLLSPVLDLSGMTEPRVAFWLWYVNSVSIHGGQPDDELVIDISNDGGSNWTNVEIVDPQVRDTPPAWERHEFRVADFVLPTDQVQLRFVASDLGNGSIVETAVDDFEVLELACRDCDGDTISDDLELLAGTATDFNGNGIPDACEDFVSTQRGAQPGAPTTPGGVSPNAPDPGDNPTPPRRP